MFRRIPPGVIDAVREKTDIVSVINQYVQLKKTGKNYSGLCPFHNEKTPSFTVAYDKQIYYCFGCGKGGNVFKFFQDLENISFPAAVKKVADIEQIPFEYEVGPKDNSSNCSNIEVANLLRMHEKAAKLYHHLLVNTKAGVPALNYLENRGLDPATIEIFQIGFAPDTRELLSNAFSSDNFSEEDYQKSGLFIILENGGKRDRFYNRLMFPIYGEQNQVIAFSGRLLSNARDEAKYLNSPETKIFQKSETLYNFNLARTSIRKANEVFLFEGFMDVIAAWRSGIFNGVASMGTALTKKQLSKLLRVANSVIVAFDGDLPGLNATEKAISALRQQTGLTVQTLLLAEKLDPDEYVCKYGEEAFHNFAEHGRSSVFEFYEKFLAEGKNLANELEKVSYLDELLGELTKVASVLERDVYLNLLSKKFPEFALESIIQRFAEKKRELSQSVKKTNVLSGQQKIVLDHPITLIERKKITVQERSEQLLLFCLMWGRVALSDVEDNYFHSPVLRKLYEAYVDFSSNFPTFNPANFINHLVEEELRNYFCELLVLNTIEKVSNVEIAELLKTIRCEEFKKKIDNQKLAQKKAKSCGNLEQELALALKIDELKKNLIKFKNF